MSRNRVLAAALLAFALIALVGGSVAGAKLIKKKFHGGVTINYEKNLTGTDRFFGTVTSAKHRCVGGALVELGFRPAFEGGGSSNVARTIVASTHADANGNWEIFYEVSPSPSYDFASFSASSPKRTLNTRKRGVVIVCKFQTSEVKTISPGP
ncbi:MAG: hypothetical protein ACJ75Z_14420 [Solirubrobacterales bacterium]